MRRVHLCGSVRGMLAWDDEFMRNMLPIITLNNGKHPQSTRELREALCDELVAGHEVLPVPECDNFDYKKGCLGHYVPDEPKKD